VRADLDRETHRRHPGLAQLALPLLVKPPNFKLDQLDPGDYLEGTAGRSGADWQTVWEYAQSFDGYRYFGADHDAPQRLFDFNLSVREAFHANRELPALPADLIRACLFMEHRRLADATPITATGAQREIHRSSVSYLQALLDAIGSAAREP